MRIGTCSWKYDAWQDIVYDAGSGRSYLQQYAAKYDTVEIDQWFWSLFGDEPVLPKDHVVKEYIEAVPDHFKFTIKMPNSLTLTHYYNKTKTGPLKPNPHFFSVDLYEQFIEKIRPMDGKIGMLMLQFEYLNKQKQASQSVFLQNFTGFLSNISRDFPLGVEIRNPNYLNRRFFEFLADHDLSMVFLQGYYMPPVASLVKDFKDDIRDTAVIRLHGPNRQAIEKKSHKQWDRIWDARDDELGNIYAAVKELLEKYVDIYINVNNHYEGSAPLTIEKIKNLRDAQAQ